LNNYRLLLLIFICSLLLFNSQTMVSAETQLSLEYQQKTSGQADLALGLDCSLFRCLELQSAYGFKDQNLSLGLVYQTKPKGAFNPYLGLGMEDLLNKTEKPWGEKTTLIVGVELKLDSFLPGVSLGLETKVIPAQLGKTDEPRLAPSLGLSVNYRLPKLSFPIGRPTNASEAEVQLLAKLVMAEAGDEPYEGQVAVAAVVLNRVKDPGFPKTIKDVIYDPGQFHTAAKLNTLTPSEAALRAAKAALAGNDPSNGACYFYNPKTSSTTGRDYFDNAFNTGKMKITAKIANHVFVKEN